MDNGSSIFDGVIADRSAAGSLRKEGSGTITLAGNNTFTGSVGINLGVLRITRSAGLGTGTKSVSINASADKLLELDGSGGNIALPSSITYQTSGVNGTIRNVAGNNTIAGAITMTQAMATPASPATAARSHSPAASPPTPAAARLTSAAPPPATTPSAA